MSGRISAVLFLISLLVAFFVYWPDDTDEAEKDQGKTRYTEYLDADGYREGLESGGVRPASRSRVTGKKAPEKIRTESGLVYQVLKQGDGDVPEPTDWVTVKYRGYLPNGDDFGSSSDERVTFPLSALVQGWREGLQLMQVGSIYRLIIPPELAYGMKGARGVVAPNQKLIFEIELLGVRGRPLNEK